MAGNLGPLSPKILATGRLRVEIDDIIHELNINKNLLLFLLTKIGKKEVGRMKFQWLTKERKPDWGTLQAVGGNWAAGAAADGTLTVPADEVWLYGAGDIIKIPTVSETNIYVKSVNVGAGVLTCQTVDGSNIDLSGVAVPLTDGIFSVSNSFELGSGMGTLKSHQPAENYNYIQITQTPYGVVETLEHVEYEAGPTEMSQLEKEKAIEHAFDIEKTLFFGRKHYQAVGYMNGVYEQYFTGGLYEAISTNIVDANGALTEAEFANWVKKITKYAEKPVIFAGEMVFEALTYWAKNKLQIRQDETTYGMAVATYLTPYGDRVQVIPHRELLQKAYAGFAFGVDLADIGYRYLKGLDTHIEVEIQQPDLKQKINEIRTWFGLWIGNEKRHGVLYNVTSIA